MKLIDLVPPEEKTVLKDIAKAFFFLIVLSAIALYFTH